MPTFIVEESFETRLRHAISVAWKVFARKVGGGLIPINKEASMQLQYAYLLKQLLPLILHNSDESADIELETGVRLATGASNIDILVTGTSAKGKTKIAIEMKCYRNITSSGGPRGAQDIFQKDVYEDLQVLEQYVEAGIASRGIALVMNDLLSITTPKIKNGKYWAYDISHGTTFSGGTINVPIGGKPVSLALKRSYAFDWSKFGSIWFTEIEGMDQPNLGINRCEGWVNRTAIP
ncbi:hypothetical protein V2I68_06720 [Pseudomonas viridiflava]|uniref:Restriction endonuclease n=1 Tax=Pseudomonas viridiflava TaxID=33069 RepID=A0ABU7N5M9_PSEVI|nr:hypothetical protein [Pseudomonas viridiflava]MEE3935244.1 hypothetical protein [Pseudomonas viridiflava]MEE4040257.1 hypothetical protein [Pseudomonas viridiflava]MEE4060742.1 hypothetical protein [Pseudomonas viridiflava]MEE4170281.1 hypothetical protein [Pseudomonas viridiflava]